MKITVAVGDDHPVVRAGLVHLLMASQVVDVVAEVDDGTQLLDAIRATTPQVALSDFRMPGLDGAALALAVAEEKLPTRVIVLSAYAEPAIVFRCLENGAAGFLSKDADRDTLIAAIRTVAAGADVLPPELVGDVLDQIRQRRTAPAAVTLSPRERDILAAAAAGRSAPEIARAMHLSTSTVKTYLRRLYEKLGVGSRGAAIAEAMRLGLLR
ncbi:putative transcriptional regulatory protein NarL [Cnuibacter physcomitrellae]|uniref:response regulator transcription factor n=1 Tax=Cnuibacter physcomitrellae TaxID=1619308 RepID=UPI0019C0C99F|nr:response regulator transcription factor [Cnuibacter physcomitrellae]GGI39688.1 putative transcriptional regulatory protein NarL [Cnuibacter physcomitrellae]